MLTRAFPPELVDEVVAECGRTEERQRLLPARVVMYLVDEVVAECGRTEERQRLLPARVVMYFVLAMCLFSGQGYEEVGRLLTQGLERERRWSKTWRVPTSGAIGRARLRLGAEPKKAALACVSG
ncbi:transposase domain-containing protein, partial [Streptomyces sanglieri]|uniref:transposase domain-containing protein n=1 Tax=Streptomyces sanglieri TaxID=193460 RepID=UPI0035263E72